MSNNALSTLFMWQLPCLDWRILFIKEVNFDYSRSFYSFHYSIRQQRSLNTLHEFTRTLSNRACFYQGRFQVQVEVFAIVYYLLK